MAFSLLFKGVAARSADVDSMQYLSARSGRDYECPRMNARTQRTDWVPGLSIKPFAYMHTCLRTYPPYELCPHWRSTAQLVCVVSFLLACLVSSDDGE